jgi:hypothetical protein
MEDNDPLHPLPTPEDEQRFVREKLEGMGFTPRGLAKRLSELGDYRAEGTVLRSIQRAASGQTRLSSELRIILTMLEKDWRRAAAFATNADWQQQTSGNFYTAARDFDIYLVGQSGGRWKVHLSHQHTKYSPSWIEWQDTLDVAKVRAFIQLDDTWLDPEWQEALATKAA